MAKTKSAETPLMKQYNGIKAKYKDAILLFRVGDFYETFGDDARTASKVLGITLTKRANGKASEIALAGFPHHSLDTYLPRLVKAGYRAAICDQLEDPKRAKKIVKRGVTELVTPGVALNDKLLDHKSNNYLASVHIAKKEFGISFLDISTGEFLVAQGSQSYIDKLIQSFQPSEIIYSNNKKKQFLEYFGEKHYTYDIDDWVYTTEFADEILLKHFGTKSLKGFGISNLQSAVIAAGAIIHYLGTTEHSKLDHITNISRVVEDKYVWLDRFTIENLELLYSRHETGVSLLDIMDKTNSPMGARLLKKWMVLPLRNQDQIQERLDLVEHFFNDRALSDGLEQQIKQIGDLERLISKVTYGKINPRQVVQLKKSLLALEPIKETGSKSKSTLFQKVSKQIVICHNLCKKIEDTIVEDPPVDLSKGEVIKAGVSAELDDYRNVSNNAKEYLEKIRQREIEKTGITSLKIGHNNVFGYYLDVTNRFKDQVPEEWIRKQTLTNSERYITEELKEYEYKILKAEEKIGGLELGLYNQTVEAIMEYIQPIQNNASLVARLDCLLCFGSLAYFNNYCKPTIDMSLEIDIKDGRHPVIEHQLKLGEQYVPNDISLDSESQQIIIITGPNMSGKSALLRQTALITLMCQMGSFVPAKSAKIGMIDKIFTRVGASDNISSGESTFMVEMNETASIMNNLSERSLVLLDEIGRGTSTYDGISIAWALTEFLHNGKKIKPKTLFATHYHELIELGDRLDRVENFHVSTKEVNNKVLFLRKIKKGGSQHSFGIHVAAMAGMPKSLLNRANEILKELESKNISASVKETLKTIPEQPLQLNMFSMDDPNLIKIKEILQGLEINALTPIEAMMKLNELKDIAGDL